VLGLDHVGLSVPDLDEAVDFFVRRFGASVLFRLDPVVPGRPSGTERLGVSPDARFTLAMLQLGRGRLELLQWWSERSPGALPEADEPGGTHVAIEVADVARCLDALCLAEEVEVVGEPVTFGGGLTPGLTNAFVRAPWGALIELVNWTDV
jgi:catechol 2,3-dioxygenase-like lactoylglutathione lyase family enzyme